MSRCNNGVHWRNRNNKNVYELNVRRNAVLADVRPIIASVSSLKNSRAVSADISDAAVIVRDGIKRYGNHLRKFFPENLRRSGI